jgi:dTDP-4-dehydrorhamnose reductase
MVRSCMCNNISVDWGIYHYAGSPFVSRFEFAKQIQIALASEGQCILQASSSADYRTPASRPKNASLDSNKACNNFRITPSDWLTALSRLSMSSTANQKLKKEL